MARPKHNQKVYDKLKMISENQTRSKSKVTQNDARNVEMTIKISITKIYIYTWYKTKAVVVAGSD